METSLAQLIERGGTESLSNKYSESKVHLVASATIKVSYSHLGMDLEDINHISRLYIKIYSIPMHPQSLSRIINN